MKYYTIEFIDIESNKVKTYKFNGISELRRWATRWQDEIFICSIKEIIETEVDLDEN